MDKEAMQVSIRYREMREQHFHGGYFSDAVRAQGELFKTLGEEEKRAFFADTFNDVYKVAQQVEAHNKDQARVDLSEHGLGIVTVDTEHHTAADLDENEPPYKGVMIFVEAFDPTPERENVWINAPGDELGLETSGPTMVQTDQEPDQWGEHVYANEDGSFHDASNYFGKLDIDFEIMRLLDAKETLDTVSEALDLTTPQA